MLNQLDDDGMFAIPTGPGLGLGLGLGLELDPGIVKKYTRVANLL